MSPIRKPNENGKKEKEKEKKEEEIGKKEIKVEAQGTPEALGRALLDALLEAVIRQAPYMVCLRCEGRVRSAVLPAYGFRCPACDGDQFRPVTPDEYEEIQEDNDKAPPRLTQAEWKRTMCVVCGCEADHRVYRLDEDGDLVEEEFYCAEHTPVPDKVMEEAKAKAKAKENKKKPKIATNAPAKPKKASKNRKVTNKNTNKSKPKQTNKTQEE